MTAAELGRWKRWTFKGTIFVVSHDRYFLDSSPPSTGEDQYRRRRERSSAPRHRDHGAGADARQPVHGVPALPTGSMRPRIPRIRRALRLCEPRRTETKLSSDPLFTVKVRDIVGLILDRPRSTLAGPPLLPMRPGQIERRTATVVMVRPLSSPPST